MFLWTPRMQLWDPCQKLGKKTDRVWLWICSSLENYKSIQKQNFPLKSWTTQAFLLRTCRKQFFETCGESSAKPLTICVQCPKKLPIKIKLEKIHFRQKVAWQVECSFDKKTGNFPPKVRDLSKKPQESLVS